MASTLLEKLNKLSGKSPDEVVAALTNPFAGWRPMGKCFESEEHWREHRNDFVLLYNTYRRHYHGSIVDFDRSRTLRVGTWGYSTWRGASTAEWYVIGFAHRTAFIMEKHHVDHS